MFTCKIKIHIPIPTIHIPIPTIPIFFKYSKGYKQYRQEFYISLSETN